jgi:hypothetical protein
VAAADCELDPFGRAALIGRCIKPIGNLQNRHSRPLIKCRRRKGGCRKLPELNDFPGAQRHLQLDVTGNRRLGYSSVTLAAQQPGLTLIQYADDLHMGAGSGKMLVG